MEQAPETEMFTNPEKGETSRSKIKQNNQRILRNSKRE